MLQEIINYVTSKGWKYQLSADKNWVRLDTCPICTRKSRKPFAINTKEGTAHCHHGECGWSGGLTLLKQYFGDLVSKIKEEKRNYAAPSESLIKELEANLYGDKSLLERYSRFRCLSEKTLKQFRIGMDSKKGVSYPYYHHGKLIALKFKKRNAEGKKFPYWWKGPNDESTQHCLYNVDSLQGNDIVYIVEGEDDCMMLSQLGFKNVVSIPHGSGTTRGTWLDPLESFHEIIIIMDGDAAGRTAAPKLADTLGTTRCRIVEFPEEIMVPPGPWGKDALEAKDITDLIRAGKEDLLRDIIKKAPIPKHDTVIHVSDCLDEFLENFRNGNRSRGSTTGYPSLDAIIGGRREGELTIVTGNTSSGKTTFTFNIGMSVSKLGEPTLMSAFEHGPKKIVDKAASWITGKTRFLGSSAEMTNADAEYAVKVMKDLPLYLVNHYGKFSPESYIDCMIYARRRLMVTTSILDHLHYTLQSKSVETERHDIDRAMFGLRANVEHIGMYLIVVAHPRQKSGEENPMLNMTDLRGSSAISQVADNIWVVWRDTDLQKLKPGLGRSIIYVLKNRSECGTIGKCEMVFDMNGQKFVDSLGNELDFVEEISHNDLPTETNEFV